MADKILISFLLLSLIACGNQSTLFDDQEQEGDLTGGASLLNEDDWHVVWEGYGNITFTDVLTLEPATATSDDETHATLVLYQPWVDNPVSDFTVTVTYTLEEQLRIGTPNPWETFWLFFNTTYNEDENAVTTNYFILKPNGVELGIAYPDSVQEFLYTNDEPTLDEGETATVSITKSGQELSVTVDGTLAFTYNGDIEEIPLLDTPGTIGLYAEDARVIVISFEENGE